MLKSHAMLVTEIQQELEERYYNKDVVKFIGRRNRRFPISPASQGKDGIKVYLPALRGLSIHTIVEIIEHELLHTMYRKFSGSERRR